MGLLNGLSAMGQGLAQYASTAGLEAQKGQLQQQNLALAAQFAATAAGKQQAFEAGQGDLTRQTQLQSVGMQTGATLGAATIGANATLAAEQTRAASAERINQETIAADTPQMKLLRAFGILPQQGGAAPGTGSANAGQAAASGATTAAPAAGNASTGQSAAAPSSASVAGSGNAAPTSPAAPGQPASSASPVLPEGNPLVSKILGLPLPGSDALLRMNIARDVASDPDFANASPGSQAMETMKRIKIAQGDITDPKSQQLMAEGIANYQMAPLNGYSLAKPGGAAIMALVQKINPNYQAARFAEVNKAMTAFGTGTQGDKVRFLNTGVQHLGVLSQAGAALAQHGIPGLNAMSNVVWDRMGYPAPQTFAALKQIVGTEVQKAISGGLGASDDRDRLMASLSAANSPDQLKGVLDGFRFLMAGQLSGLKNQYEDATGIKTGPFSFDNKLDPETAKTLGSQPGGATAPASAQQAASAPAPRMTSQQAVAQARQEIDQSGIPMPPELYNKRVEQRALVLLKGQPGGQAATPPAIPSWVKPGDQYSPSRGLARAADGTTYGQPSPAGTGQ